MDIGSLIGSEYRLLAEAVPQLIWVTDAGGAVEYVNQQFTTYTGFGTAELLGETQWRKALHPDDLERCLSAWNGAVATGSTFETEYRLRRASDATWRWHLARALPVKDDANRVVKWFGTCTDIEDQKQVQASLRQAEERTRQENRRKDEFLAMLGHELRNPLAPILLALDILKLRGEQSHEVAVIERQVKHMKRIVDDILDVARINGGRVELRKERHELAVAVESAIAATRRVLDERGHTLVVDVARDGLAVNADPARLAQVISNLLDNAATYMNPHGVITIRATRAGDDVSLSVRDNGVGIPAEILPDVFDPFVQGERPLDRSQGGLGIGLTLVRDLVEMHGGSVAASSEGIGHGSEFVVRLPAATAPSARGARRRNTETGRLRVLVVDDNVDAAGTLESLLRETGFDVATAHDGQAAVDAALESVPDVVLLDIGLPKLNGYEVARRIRAEPRLATTRLIALTGHALDEDREKSRASGFHDHLVKPIDLDHLLDVLDGPRPLSPNA